MNNNLIDITNEQYISHADLLFFKKWYFDFTNNYKIDDQKDFLYGDLDLYEIKKEHIKDVQIATLNICQKMKLNDNITALAEAIALFHDIGRFEQFKRYKTIDDSITIDHGILSCKILNESKILNRLNPVAKKTILVAISQHNNKNINLNTSPKYIFFCKLLRDADKASLFPYFADTFPKYKSNMEDGKGLSDEVYNKVINYEKIDRYLIKSNIDNTVYILTWLFDISFIESIDVIIESRSIEKFLTLLPHNNKADKVKKSILNYLYNYS